jgi:hypothetical protein
MLTLETTSNEGDAMTMFRAAHNSAQTLDHNERFLGYFLKAPRKSVKEVTPYLDMTPEEFVTRIRTDLKWGEAKIAGYFLTIKERINRKEITSDSSHNYRDPIKTLLDMNDIEVNWKRLDKILPPRRRKPSKGEAVAKEILQTLCRYQDSRIDPIVKIMTSAGIRVGAWDFLSVRDVEPVYLNGKLVCGKIIVYWDTPEEYTTRISLEAYNALMKYIEFRKQAGENITPESPLMRDSWVGGGDKYAKGWVRIPKRLKGTGVKRLLEDAWTAFPNLRTKIGKRYNIKATHFGRKYFETICLKAGLEPWEIKVFRGDILPVDLGYQGFTEDEWTEKYVKAMPFLEIFESVPQTSSASTAELESLRKEFGILKANAEKSEERNKRTEEFVQGSLKLGPEAFAELVRLVKERAIEREIQEGDQAKLEEQEEMETLWEEEDRLKKPKQENSSQKS